MCMRNGCKIGEVSILAYLLEWPMEQVRGANPRGELVWCSQTPVHTRHESGHMYVCSCEIFSMVNPVMEIYSGLYI